jgi:hypothetical protein
LLVRREMPVHQVRRTRARAPFRGALLQGSDDLRMIGEP